MSISNNYSPDKSLGNGVTTQFSGNWKVLNASYFRCALESVATGIQTLLTLGFDYTLTFNDSGYIVTLTTPPTSADYVVRYREVDLTQTDPYRTSKGFQGKTIEDSFDKLTAIDQDQQDDIERSLRFQVGSSAIGYQIDDPVNNRALKWDTINKRIVNSSLDPDEAATQAAASAAAALISENNSAASAAAALISQNASAVSALLAQSWAIDPIGSRPEGSSKYWAEQSQLAVGGVKVTVNDTTPAPLNTKLLVGSGFTKAVNNPAGNETLTLSPDMSVLAPAALLSGMKNRVLSGLTISNNVTDATNDIDIAAGSAVSDDGTTIMTLSSAITKRLDAAWAVGNNQGGRDTGSIADGGWYVWLIHRTDTGVTDVLFSQSATAPTMPANYTKKKRIGSFMRISAAIRPFTQRGNVFWFNSPVADFSGNISTSEVTITLSVPTGEKTEVGVASNHARAAGGQASLYLSDPDNLTGFLWAVGWASGATANGAGTGELLTNTSGQISGRTNASQPVEVYTKYYKDRGI